MARNVACAPENGTPVVSVVVPVRDGERFLGPALSSLGRCRTPALEFVLVDDGSRDATPELLGAFARADGRVRLCTLPPMGLVAALNAGLAVSRGTFIARFDADDVVHPDRFHRQVSLAEAQGLDVVGTGVRCFPTQRIGRGLRRYEAWQNGLVHHDEFLRDRFVESPLVHPSVLMRREVLLDVGGYRDEGWPEDYDLWLRLLNAGARFGKCPEILTFWRDHPERFTRTARACNADRVLACKVAHLLAGPLAGAERIWIAGAGDDAKALARALVAAGRAPEAFLDINPRRIGQRIGDVPVRALESFAPAERRFPTFTLVAVGAAGRRDIARAYFAEAGMQEGRDFLCAA